MSYGGGPVLFFSEINPIHDGLAAEPQEILKGGAFGLPLGGWKDELL